MRKLGMSAIVLAVLLLPACGDDGEAGSDQTAASQETSAAPVPSGTATEKDGGNAEGEEQKSPAPDEAGSNSAEPESSGGEGGSEQTENQQGGGEIGDLSTALLTAGDLPEGAEITPLDVEHLRGSLQGMNMSGMLDDVTYEPAECKNNSADPMTQEGVEAAAITATSGDGTSVLVNGVYAGASADDFAELEKYFDTCGEVAISGSAAGQEIDMTITTTLVDPPDLDVDSAIAMEVSMEMAGMPETPMQIVYLVDGSHGVYLAGTGNGGAFDVNGLAGTALERLRAAQG